MSSEIPVHYGNEGVGNCAACMLCSACGGCGQCSGGPDSVLGTMAISGAAVSILVGIQWISYCQGG